MPEVQDRDAAESKLQAALVTVWNTWTSVADPAVLNARELMELLRENTFQPLWEVYYRAQYVVAQELRVAVSEQVIAAAFLLYYSNWASDVAARWMSRVSTWLLEARMAAHANRRAQAATQATTQQASSTATPSQAVVPAKQSGPTSTATPPAAAPSATSGTSSSAIAVPEKPVPTQAVSPTQATAGQPVDMTPTQAKPGPESPKVIEVPGAKPMDERPKSIADEVADNWRKSKAEVLSPDAIETYSRDGVTRTNSQGELTVVDAAKQSGRRIEGIWKLDPTSNWCQACYDLDGTTRDVWGKVAPNGPQLHPRCACSIEYVEVDQDGKPVDYTPWRDRPF
jgi:hypothetical protein